MLQWQNSLLMAQCEETPWLKEAPCHSLATCFKRFRKSLQKLLCQKGRLSLALKRKATSSFRYPDPQQIKLDQANSRIFLPKLGWIRYRKSREVIGELRNVTVSNSGKKWFISIQTEREIEKPKPTATTAIGIDVGIARFATISDGSYIAPLNSFKKHQARLAKYQRRMSRKVKFSNNWKKAKTKVQKIHTDIANARKDFLHKITTTISKNHALVCVEDLQVRNMSKSAKEQANSQEKGCDKNLA